VKIHRPDLPPQESTGYFELPQQEPVGPDDFPRHRGTEDVADLVVRNVRAITLNTRRPIAEAIAIQGERILAVGRDAELRPLIGPTTTVLDGRGAVAIPAFHDAHLHLLSYARSRSWIDCRGAQSIAEIGRLLADAARELPPGAWIRGYGYDDEALAEGRHPDRQDLDAAVLHHPLRLQHRTLHLDILNSAAIRALGLAETTDLRVERTGSAGELTGRIYHGGDLLHRASTHPADHELGRDVRAASDRLLRWGVTSVQDASVTNGVDEWELFHCLAERGDLRVRVFMMWGAMNWRERATARPASALVRHGPVKFMLDERAGDAGELRAGVMAAAAAGYAVAIHAVSEAEVAIALDALRTAPCSPLGPHRIEHGSVIADEWLTELRTLGITVVGQPALVYERGDLYLREYRGELHGWLHRARSLLEAGIPYAVGSDAPVIEPDPATALYSLRTRATRAGKTLGLAEALDLESALAACTLQSAEAGGVGAELGALRPGTRADIALLDGDLLGEPGTAPVSRSVRATFMNGAVVWKRAGSVGEFSSARTAPADCRPESS
jgi:predicted amidohydrolase YtcJ